MKLEDQLTSLKPSKRLKELGVKQKSIYYHTYEEKGSHLVYGEFLIKNPETLISAFSVAELYEIFTTDLSKSQVGIHWNHNLFTVSFQGKIMFHNKQLADAMAKMLIYLLENKMIKL